MRLAPRGRFAQQNKTGFTSPPDHARRAAAAPQAPRLPHARVWRVAESSRVSGLLLRRLRRASVGMFTMGRALRVGRQRRVAKDLKKNYTPISADDAKASWVAEYEAGDDHCLHLCGNQPVRPAGVT